MTIAVYKNFQDGLRGYRDDNAKKKIMKAVIKSKRPLIGLLYLHVGHLF